MTVNKITLYYADWCGHCVRFKPVWKELKEYIKSNKIPIIMEDYEADKDKEIVDKAGVRSFPTILVEEETKKTFEYNGDRSSVRKILDTLKIKSVGQTGGGYLSSVAVLSNDYQKKYMKYKLKYLKLKNHH